MNIGFVIGNGASVTNLNLDGLFDRGTVYSCNTGIYRHRSHHTVAVDRNTVIDIASNGYPSHTTLWTRSEWADTLSHERPIRGLPRELYSPQRGWDRELNWGSGTHAVWMASESANVVVLLGFDLWNSNRSPKCSIYQIQQTSIRHPRVSFIQIQSEGWPMPESWSEQSNIKLDQFSVIRNWLTS